MFESIRMVAVYFQWILVVAIAVISFRCVYIIHHMSNSMEENASMSAILGKVRNHVKALIILVVVEGIVEYIKYYLF